MWVNIHWSVGTVISLDTTTSSLKLFPKISTLKPRLTATSIIRSPRYYGHFFWPPGKNRHTFSCKNTLVSTPTPLIRPIFYDPLVTVLTGFHYYTVVQVPVCSSWTLWHLTNTLLLRPFGEIYAQVCLRASSSLCSIWPGPYQGPIT